jgi:hypothetical protein
VTVALVVPIVLVNLIAVYGQGGWAYDNLVPADVRHHHPTVALLLSLGFAVTVESVGIYLAVEAHLALMAGDASARLRFGSYAIGALVGVLNYAHFAGTGGSPTALAITFGLLSSISPWLWAIRSRSLNRDRLRDLGQVDPRAVRFAPLRWVLFPRRTWLAFRAAVWAGVVRPADAIALVERKTTPASVDAEVTTTLVATTDPPVASPPAAPAPPARSRPSRQRRAPSRDTTRDTTRDKFRDKFRDLASDGKSVSEILLALGMPKTPANRRKVERATVDLRQPRQQRQGA